MKYIYLDNNATTKTDEKVVDFMNKFYLETFAVASSQFSHSAGIVAKDGVENARSIIAKSINAKEEEIVFTSGETESNNIAIRGVAKANKNMAKNKIIISSTEHFSVVHTAKDLEHDGYSVVEIKSDSEGFIDLNHLESEMGDDVLLVSVQIGNHETGNIQDIKAISKIVKKYSALLHTNATYSYLQTKTDVTELNIDLMTIEADKIYGPKGVGAIFVKKGTPIKKIFEGGFQESNLRPGTENVPGIAGFGKAVEIFDEKINETVANLRNTLYEKINENITRVLVNGPSDFTKRLPNNLNVSFELIEGESVVLHLDMKGIAVITGSACFSRSLQASHILMAMGFSHERAHGSIRFSPGKYNTIEEMIYTAEQTKIVVEKLRELSPLT